MNPYDAILHIDVGDPDRLKMVLHNAVNYLNALPNEKFELDIIGNGGSAVLFTTDQPELHDLAKPVIARGVKIKVCANAMADKGVPREKIWPECQIVPAGLVEVVRLQKAGFAYIKP